MTSGSPPKARDVRLLDVARAAGVSTATASRALNAPEHVSEELKERIRAAAERLGYLPNLAARALATRRSGLVGILADEVSEPFMAAFIEAMDKPLRQEGYSIVLAMGNRADESDWPSVRDLLARGVDAIISRDASPAPTATGLLTGLGKPWLVLSSADNSDITGYGAGAALACGYLRSLGHERIVVVVPPTRGSVEAAIRRALVGTGAQPVTMDAGLDHSGNSQHAYGALLDRRDRPTAVVCASDVEAVGLLRECRLRGVEVPGALSVVGFGDTEIARCAWPSLTTVRVAMNALAASVVETLIAMLAGQGPSIAPPPVKLVVRESTAVPPR